MSFRRMNGLVVVPLLMALLAAPAAAGENTLSRTDAASQAKRRVSRERQFLLRTVEDLNRSRGYVRTAVNVLEAQAVALDDLDPARRFGSLLEWYRSYEGWLAGALAEFEADLAKAYADERGAVVSQKRYSSLMGGYARLGAQLEAQVSRLEKSIDSTNARIAVLRSALDYLASSAFIEERNRERNKERNKERKDPRPGSERRRDEMYERYKDITDAEIARMRLELTDLGELQKHYTVLAEMARMELPWLGRRTDDCEALGLLAGVVGKDATAPIEEATSRMIRQYESDIAFFNRKIEEISGARARVVPSGTMRTLERMEALSESYERMKGRFEHHVTWLAEQAGAYRADLVEIRSGK